MRYLLMLSISLILAACDQINFKKLSFEDLFKKDIPKVEYVEYSKNTIQFKDNVIVLSHEYFQNSTEQFKSRLDSLDRKSRIKRMAYRDLKRIENLKKEYQIFVDKNNVGNYVFIYARNYTVFNEHSAANHVARLGKAIKKESNLQAIRYKRIHGRYFYTENAKIVKLKYLKDKMFQTEYIVSSKNGGGVGLLVSNIRNIDFEESIKTLALEQYD